MTQTKTKKALLMSVLSMMLCVAMLVGMTFAWFTDTASTGVNKIQAGNLDVKLSYKAGDTFKEVSADTQVLGNHDLWEPGHVEYAVLKVENAGTLALKYKLGINIASETGSTNVEGKEFKLSDYIKFTVVDGDQATMSRAELVKEAGAGTLIKEGYTSEEGKLVPSGSEDLSGLQSEKVVTLVVWMPESVGNEANYDATKAEAPEINLGINVAATQLNHENDSFGPDYDASADYPEIQPVSSSQDLKDVLASDDIDGKTIKLYDDIDADTLNVTGKNVALDLNGKTLDTKKIEVKNSTMVVKDSSASDNGVLKTADSSGVINAVNSDVTIESGKFVSEYAKEGSSGYGNVIQTRNSNLTINGGYFENSDNVGSYNYLIKVSSYNSNEKTTVIINGGEFISHRNYGYVVTGDSSANVDVTINGGKFTTKGSNSYLTNVKGNVVVNDCEFVAEGCNTVFNIPKDSTVTVKGGTYKVNENSYTDTSLAGFIFHRKTNGWTSVGGTLLVDPTSIVKINQQTYSGFIASGAVQSTAKDADGFYTISK